MKFGNFLFPDSRDPAHDGAVIDETLREAALSDALGVDVVWLAEHHFDGICAYVDPITFAAALAPTLQHSSIGFAVVQTSLHHPVRLAEQLSLLDHLTKGRLIVGLGRGTAFNIYDYQGFGLDHHEAQARLEEAEAIMRKAWAGAPFTHEGRFWHLKVPMLRPVPYTAPHPRLIRAASGEHSLVELARQGRPFLMNVQTLDATARRVGLYRDAMREAGYGDDAIAANLGASWVWRNLYVAATDAEAERVGVPYFEQMTRARAELRNRIYAETGERIEVPRHELPEIRASGGAPGLAPGLLRGSPTTVAEAIAGIARLGVGGVLASFRLGPMPHEVAAASLALFMREVAPHFRR